ncbi:hypothetical protein ES703_51233 [subsurface metagenome]
MGEELIPGQGWWKQTEEFAERNELVGGIIEKMPEVGLLGMILKYGQIEGPNTAVTILSTRIGNRMMRLSTLSIDELREIVA